VSNFDSPNAVEKLLLTHDSGFAFDLREVDRELLEDRLIEANNDSSVDGIIVYYPIFGSRQDQYLQQIVSIDKDVEGLSHRYIFNMYQNIRFLDPASSKKSILPCTPLAVIKILEYLRIYNTILPYGNRLHGRTITVINRSEVVGRPLAALLANDGAHVYSVDIADVQEFTRGVGLRKRRHEVNEKAGWTLENCLPLSDVVISGVPGDKYKVPLEKMKDGAVCINFSSERNFTPEVKEKASIYVPAIGKVTIAVLLRNLLVSIRMLSLWILADSSVATRAKQDRCGSSGCGRNIVGRASHSIDSMNGCLLCFILCLLILIPYRRHTCHTKVDT
jgi:methylenetetrahydrofolate dehydrogenase (NAD+)